MPKMLTHHFWSMIMSEFSLLVCCNVFWFHSGGVTKSEGFDDAWPPLDDFEAPYREPILAPTTNSLTTNHMDGIVSILPAPPQIVSKYNENKRRENSNVIKSGTTNAVISHHSNQFSPSLLLQNINNNANRNKQLNNIKTTSFTKTIHQPQSTDSGFVPVVPTWLSTQVVQTTTKAPKVAKFKTILSHTNNAESIRFSRQLPEVQTFDQLIFPPKATPADVNNKVFAPNSNSHNNRQVWSQISAGKPTWTERQRPILRQWRQNLSHRKRKNVFNNNHQSARQNNNNNVVVKHGIYPIKKKKPPSFRLSSRRNFRASRLYYL